MSHDKKLLLVSSLGRHFTVDGVAPYPAAAESTIDSRHQARRVRKESLVEFYPPFSSREALMLRPDEILDVIKMRKAIGVATAASMCDENRGSIVPPPRCPVTAEREAGVPGSDKASSLSEVANADE